MAASCAAWLRQRLSNAALCILLLLLFSSTALFIVTYQKYWTFHQILLPVLDHEYTRNSRDFSITLLPEKHNRRDPTTIFYYWNITKGYRTPDGVRKLVYLVNGRASFIHLHGSLLTGCWIDQFPGPTIEARSGDRLEILVSNYLEEEEVVAIHWHGLHMRGTIFLSWRSR